MEENKNSQKTTIIITLIVVGSILIPVLMFVMFVGSIFSNFNKTQKSMMDIFKETSTTMQEDYRTQTNEILNGYNSKHMDFPY